MSKALKLLCELQSRRARPKPPRFPGDPNYGKALNIDLEPLLCDEVSVPEWCYGPVTVNLTRG
jgi:hypothetical protein